MITHTVIKCDFCDKKILLRFQIGYFDILYDFYCPNCGVTIKGKYKIDTNELMISNAADIGERIEEAEYYGDFCAELPSKKISKYISIESILDDGFGPFMSTVSMFNSNQQYFDNLNKINKFLEFKNTIWEKIYPLYDIYYNNKFDILGKKISEISKNYEIKNELDATISLHQLTTIGMSRIMINKTLTEFSELSKKIIMYNDVQKIKEFINYLETKINFKEISRKVIKILSRWINDFEKYLPIVILNLSENNNKIDKEKYGISTTSFDDIKSFYADTYELILDMIEIPIGLNNIFERNDFNKFLTKFNFNSFYRLQKSNRIKYLYDNEPFTKSIEINRNVRNAISHYDYDMDKATQEILFIDKFKGEEKKIKMYLIDLGLLCYENVKIIVYLNELLYSLRKIKYLSSGMMSNINPRFKSNNMEVK